MIFKKFVMGFTLSLSVIASPVLMAMPASAADVMLSTPTGLKTTDQTPTSIGLVWNQVSGAPQYRVQFSTSPDMSDAGYARSVEGEKEAKIDMRDLKPNTTYYFKVRVIKTDGTNLSSYSPSITVKTRVAPVLSAIPNQLSVATYNIHCANCNTDPTKSWINRRDSVIANVKSRMPDVMGIQEASQGWIDDDAGNRLNLSQFEDFRNRLNTAGAPYEVTNPNRNNCVNSTTPTNCVYADKGASFGTKIFYNKNTVTLLAQGSAALPNLPGDEGNRHMSWASFKQNSTGKSFFFTNAHIDPRTGTPEIFEEKRQQALKIVQVIKEKNTANLPVFITGDMNSTKWTVPGNLPYDEFVKAGYVDPIGGTYQTSLASGYATAEKIINGRFNSYNGFNPNIGKTSATGDRALGSHLDYIFTSKMRVASWEQVLNVDANGVIQSAIPSDHNMIVARVGLPDVVGTPAPITNTPIAIKAASLNGALGAATSAEVYGLKDNGSYQCYQLGCIIYSPSTGAYVSTGAIRTTWASTGFENGFLGYPTGDEVGGLRNGGAYQMYQGGAIIWSPATGAQISTGGIRSAWAATGYQDGFLGYPTTNEISGLKNGGVYQLYEQGAIIWSPQTGSFTSTGGIRVTWLNAGAENGALGYPVSNEIKNSNGSVVQHFQGGSITWTAGAVNISYK